LVVKEVKPLLLEAQEPIKLQSVLTPTSTATSGMSSNRELGQLSRSPTQLDERYYVNRTAT